MKWTGLLFLVLEIFVTIEIGSVIGGFNVVLEVLLTALIGMLIFFNFKSVLMQSMMAVMTKQMSPADLIKGNLMGFIGAVLLILPGFLTDTVGIVFLLFFVKSIYFPKSVKEESYTPKNKGDEDVIDVEIIESISDRK